MTETAADMTPAMENGDPTETAARAVARIETALAPLIEMIASDPRRLADDRLLTHGFRRMVAATDDPAAAGRVLVRGALTWRAQRNRLLEAVKKLDQAAPREGYALTEPMAIDGEQGRAWYVCARPHGERPDSPGQFFRIPGDLEALGESLDEAPAADDPPEFPPPPYVALLDPAHGLFLGPAVGRAPEAPVPATIARVHAAGAEGLPGGAGELILASTNEDDAELSTVLCRTELADDVRRRLREGQNVRVRVEAGIATAVFDSEDHRVEGVEDVPADGPGVHDLAMTASQHEEWERDAQKIADGRGVAVALIGPTGCGKTTSVERIGIDALRLARRAGREVRGVKLIRLSLPYIGSSYIHATERNLRRRIELARRLTDQGYLVIVLLDEGDAMVGEMHGGTHTHDRSERLAAQELLSRRYPFAIYLTMNPRMNSWLPAAMQRRFARRVYPRRTPRGQMLRVAEIEAAEHPAALERAGLAVEEFAAAFVDGLYADDRIVAYAHMRSGQRRDVRIRDLAGCCPAKVRELIAAFCEDVEYGSAEGLDALWARVEREFDVSDLSARNFYELTSFTPSPHDAVHTVEYAR